MVSKGICLKRTQITVLRIDLSISNPDGEALEEDGNIRYTSLSPDIDPYIEPPPSPRLFEDDVLPPEPDSHTLVNESNRPFSHNLIIVPRPSDFDPRSDLRCTYLQGYVRPAKPRVAPEFNFSLDASQFKSLQHYYVWAKTNSSLLNYDAMRKVHSDPTSPQIMTLHKVKKLVLGLTGVEPKNHDMCPLNHIAFTGPYAHLSRCPHKSGPAHNPTICNEPRFTADQKPRRQFITMSIAPRLRALHRNPKTALLLRSRAELYKASRELAAIGKQNFRDFPDGDIHHRLVESGVLANDTDSIFVLGADGAQLRFGKKDGAWFVQLTFWNLPFEAGRQQQEHTMVVAMFPGYPVDFDSFMWPVYAELALLGEGIWVEDAVARDWIQVRGHVIAETGDAPGQQKFHMHTGYRGTFGDLYSYAQALSLESESGKNAWPLKTPDSVYLLDRNTRGHKWNKTRPREYKEVPLRKENDYYDILHMLASTQAPTHLKELRTSTGVMGTANGIFSHAFTYPYFWPLDPAHMIYANIVLLFWDLWTVRAIDGDPFCFDRAKRELVGEIMEFSVSNIPAALGGAPSNIHLNRNSQYKLWEWAAFLHWFSLPMLFRMNAPTEVIAHWGLFVESIDAIMNHEGVLEEALPTLQRKLDKFVRDFEKIYVRGNIKLVSRCRLYLFQLCHIPEMIRNNGTFRLGSQFGMERTIGFLKHRISSWKEPFSNIAEKIVQQEILFSLAMQYPELENLFSSSNYSQSKPDTCVPTLTAPIHTSTKAILTEQDYHSQRALASFAYGPINATAAACHSAHRWPRFANARLKNGLTIRSIHTEKQRSAQGKTRHACRVKVSPSSNF
jgi:hypothetical protein